MLIPALDILNGEIVRLKQGDFNRPTTFSTDPITAAITYANQGADYLHLVDLNGARNPADRQTKLIKQVQQACQIPVQSGGGIRCRNDISRLLDNGISRVVIGSVAVKEPQKTATWLKEFGSDSLVFALDIVIEQTSPDQKPKRWLATHGWQQTSQVQLDGALNYLVDAGGKHVLCTDIQRDGMLSGPNVPLYADLKKDYPDIAWQASGGINQLSDLRELKRTDCDSVILGKALLRGHFSLQEAISCWQNG